MSTFKPFTNQRMSGPQEVNTGYTSSEVRSKIREKYQPLGGEGILGAIHATLKSTDDFLYHQFYLRDMAYTCLQDRDIKGAMKWLEMIGEDKP